MKVNFQARQTCARAGDARINPGNSFITKDGLQYYSLSVSRYDKTWAMSVAHELGHVLGCRKEDGHKLDSWSVIRREIMAWRIGKSICKTEYWKEGEALESLASHIMSMDNWKEIYRKVLTTRLKIIPLNAGVSLK
jgi:hypothetical protein